MVTTAEENVQVGRRILLNYLKQRQGQVTRPIFLKMIVEHNDDDFNLRSSLRLLK